MISGSVIRNAAVDLRFSAFCRLERFRAGCEPAALFDCNGDISHGASSSRDSFSRTILATQVCRSFPALCDRGYAAAAHHSVGRRNDFPGA